MMLKLSFSSFSTPLLLVLLLYSIIGMNMNITTDESSLLALKSSIKVHSHHIIMTNWSNASSVCEWVGVMCGSRDHRVIALDISNMELLGTIPPQIGNLSFLVSFNASGNNFSGNLPDDLIHLRRLRVFDFSVNGLSGEVPSWFGFLSNLQMLNIGQNKFKGSIPLSFSNLSKIETLNMESNLIQGYIPKDIGKLHSLKNLELNFNQFNGSIPSTIFNISTLENLGFVGNLLSGTLPFDLCRHLGNLKRLDVTQNLLNGEIPRGLSRCSNITYLGLSYNHFEGMIPLELGNLTSLEILLLGGNNLRGRIPEEIGYLHGLQILRIENNHIMGMLPLQIFNISSLRVLNLNTNNISGTIPVEINQLQKLKSFISQFNSFTGFIPWGIFNISTLADINLSFNRLSGTLPPTMGYRLPNLTLLALNDNSLSGAIPSYISNCSKLKTMDFSSNSFNGPIPNTLGQLRLLQELELEENELKSESTSFITSLVNCRYLRELWVGLNPLNTILPSTFGNLSISLDHFSAFGCNIKGEIPIGIGNLSRLTSLDLGENDLSGFVPRTISGLVRVQEIYFDENRLSGSLPNDMCNLRYLGRVVLLDNQIWGPIPKCIGNATSLREINLNSNQLSFSIPSSLWNLKDLLILDLSSNLLNGSLPLEIGNLKVAIYVNLSLNHFSGFIPNIFGGLQQLQNISLANNLLQGSIPESFAHIINLEYLDLSNNNLTGEIPKLLETLHYLKFFNVSFNRLSGEIPSKGLFVSFTYQSFLSNEELCGSPRFKVPPCKAHSVSHISIRKVIWIVFISVAALTMGIFVMIFIVRKYKKNKNPTANDVDLLREIVPLPLRISYYELQLATQGFDSSNLLGVGGFGSVYKGTFRDGSLFAIKVFNLQVESAFRSFDTECHVLCNLRHRNLTKVISACSNMDFKALILQYMPNGSLDSWLHSDKNSLDFMQRLNIMIDVACALEYLHHGYTIPIVHCDLKPSNVLIDEDMVGHVSDFGIAKLLGNNETVVYTITMATIGYTAPEYGSRGMVSTRCDIYSYGIMLMEVFTKRKPNDEMFNEDLSLKNWVYSSLSNTPDEIVDPILLRAEELQLKQTFQCISYILELALNCTVESPEDRMDIRTILLKLNKIKHQCLTIF